MLWRAGNYRTPGVVSKVNLVLGGLPRFTAAGGDDETLLRGRIVVAPGIDAIERAFDAVEVRPRLASRRSSRRRSRRSSTRRSSTTPPAGTHVMSVIAQYTPYALRDGAWDDDGRRDAARRRRSSRRSTHWRPGSPVSSASARS